MDRSLCALGWPPGLAGEVTSEPSSRSPGGLGLSGASLPAILAHTHLFKNSHQIVSIVLLDQMEDGRLNTGL